MNKTQFLQALANIRVFAQNGQRAPHKPLLILLMLGRVQQGLYSPISWLEIRKQLSQLLQDFGRPARVVHPEFPFWHLRSDRFWVLTNVNGAVTAPLNQKPTLGQLAAEGYRGSFSDGVLLTLRADPELVIEAARFVLNEHFPVTIHEDILTAVDLSLDLQEGEFSGGFSGCDGVVPGVRSGSFRLTVLTAYRHKCCICGFSLRMGNQLVGVEAAHIRWVKARGPNTVNNGLALCSVHHKLFDFGAFTVLDDGWRLKVSDHLNGGGAYFDQLMQFREREIAVPDKETDLPTSEFLRWHREEVFRG